MPRYAIDIDMIELDSLEENSLLRQTRVIVDSNITAVKSLHRALVGLSDAVWLMLEEIRAAKRMEDIHPESDRSLSEQSR